MATTLNDSMKITCPRSFKCDPPLHSFDIGLAPSYVSLVSSFLSCLGSVLILAAYAQLKDMRTGAQTVVTLLAVADFFTAFGYIIGAANFLVHFNDVQSSAQCEIFEAVCTIQSFITTWSTMSSYCWTCILAFYFFLVIVYDKVQLAAKLIPLYNVIAWAGPLTIMLPLLGWQKLGYAPYVASNWCYIKDSDYKSDLKGHQDVIVFILVAGKLWEMITYVFIMVIYISIKIHIRKTRKRIEQFEQNSSCPTRVAQVEKRLLAIPLLYILLRMWGTLQFFYSLTVSGQKHGACIPEGVKIVYTVLGILQAIGDGGQGWCNAVLYIFLSKTMRNRLLVQPFKSCLHIVLDKVDELLETTDTRTRRYREVRPVRRREYFSINGGSETRTLSEGDVARNITGGHGNSGSQKREEDMGSKVMEVSLESVSTSRHGSSGARKGRSVGNRVNEES